MEAGRWLAEIHLGYEWEDPFPLDGLGAEPTGDPYEFFAVQKINFAKKRSPETRRAEADKCQCA